MTSVSDLLKAIAELQSDGDGIYPSGTFPSQRYHPFLPYTREDDNLFFSATIALTLQSHLSEMTEDERSVAETIINNVRSAIPLFRNKDGKPTYNFWQTKPSRHFPNGVFMRHLEHFRIPDDADDTALAHILVDHSEEEVDKLLQLFELHANLGKKQVKNTWSEFQELYAISTFFGEKMRIEFDAVVMCNALLFLLSKGQRSKLVEDSTKYVSGVVERDHHLTDPFRAAPNYPNAVLIIYHIARLLKHHPDIELARHRSKLIGQLKKIGKRKTPALNQLLINNALIMLGDNVKDNVGAVKVVNDTKGYFFHAGMMSAFENSVAQNLSTNPLFHLRYRCKALNMAMLVEYQLLKRKLAV